MGVLKRYGRPMTVGIVAVLLIVSMVNGCVEKGIRTCLPFFSYISFENGTESRIEERINGWFPAFAYLTEKRTVIHRQDKFQLKRIKNVELLTMMEFENIELPIKEDQVTEQITDEAVKVEPDVGQEVAESTEMIQPIIPVNEFVPHSLQSIVDIEGLKDFENLVSHFYTIDTAAGVDAGLLNAEKLNSRDLRITKSQEGPQILIYHTHSQEAFADSVPGEESTTIVGVGEHLTRILTEKYGYQVLHHKGQYDVKTRDDAYSRALPDVQKVLEENPTIQVVIDLHRDGVAEGAAKLVMDLDGRPTARFMFFNGVSRGKKSGNIDYLHNPNLEENMAFSFQLKKAAEEYYPGLTRKNYINAYRYNMHLCGRTTLIELGAQNNTVEEVLNACEPIAHILDLVLSGA